MSDPNTRAQIESNTQATLLAGELRQQLRFAAEVLQSDYTDQNELIVFIALDGEDFHAFEDDR